MIGGRKVPVCSKNSLDGKIRVVNAKILVLYFVDPMFIFLVILKIFESDLP